MRLLEIASAEEQIALWKLVSDSVWAALQLQQSQQGETVPTRARATDAAVKQSTRKPTKNAALKSVLKGHGRVGKLPTVPVPSKSTTKSQTSTDPAGSSSRPPESQRQPTLSSPDGRPNRAVGKQPVLSTVKSLNTTISNPKPVDSNNQPQPSTRDQLPTPQITPPKIHPISPKPPQKPGYFAQNQSKINRDRLDTRQA